MSTGQAHADAPIRSLSGVQILGSGRYVPERVVTNQDLQESLGFDPTGSSTAPASTSAGSPSPTRRPATSASPPPQRCLADADCDPAEVDLLVVGTMTPDMAFPSTGCLVQDRMKLRCPAFDLQAACAGFIYAMMTAAQFVAAGTSQRALAIGGDCNSRVINPGDQKSYPLFGDGAGAVLLGPGEPGAGVPRLPARLRRLGRRPAQPAGLRQPPARLRPRRSARACTT